MGRPCDHLDFASFGRWRNMGVFIEVEIDMNRCVGINKCGQCVQVCPVNIFGQKGDIPIIIKENEDECTLCELCLKGCTQNAIVTRRLYEE